MRDSAGPAVYIVLALVEFVAIFTGFSLVDDRNNSSLTTRRRRRKKALDEDDESYYHNQSKLKMFYNCMLAQAAVTISTMVLVLAGFTSMSLDSFEFILITGGLIRFFLILIALGGVVSMKMSFGSPTMTSFIKYTFCCAAAAGIIDNFIMIYQGDGISLSHRFLGLFGNHGCMYHDRNLNNCDQEQLSS